MRCIDSRLSLTRTGQALKRNPYPADLFEGPPRPHMVPCYRVICSDMSLGGFSGSTELGSDNIRRKMTLLRAEGVRLHEDAAKGTVSVDGRPCDAVWS